jgi:hypothetical protein
MAPSLFEMMYLSKIQSGSPLYLIKPKMDSSPCMDYTWDPSQYTEANVYPEVFGEAYS